MSPRPLQACLGLEVVQPLATRTPVWEAAKTRPEAPQTKSVWTIEHDPKFALSLSWTGCDHLTEPGLQDAAPLQFVPSRRKICRPGLIGWFFLRRFLQESPLWQSLAQKGTFVFQDALLYAPATTQLSAPSCHTVRTVIRFGGTREEAGIVLFLRRVIFVCNVFDADGICSSGWCICGDATLWSTLWRAT